MNNYIECLKWDTDFFGFKVGKLVLNSNLISLNEICSTYNLIYIYSKDLLDITKTNIKINLIDTKITLRKKLNVDANREVNFELYDPIKDSYENLLELVFLSGSCSRFKRDNRFGDLNFMRLYKQWIDNIMINPNSQIIIRKDNNKIIGFATLEKIDSELSKIDLIAVHSDFQKNGIGSFLISCVDYASYLFGVKKVEVATQEINISALNLYLKSGFEIKDKINIYHYWKDDTI